MRTWRHEFNQEQKSVVKLQRVHGGCLGVQSRRRTWLGCEKPRGAAKQAMIRGCPISGNRPGFISWYLGNQVGTQGTETSKYLQERKETSTLSVAASERRTAQTVNVPKGQTVALAVSWDSQGELTSPRELPIQCLGKWHGKANRRR